MSVARCPEQNGVAEKINRTLVESARAMIAHAGLPNCFWAEAVATAAYLRNRLPTSTFKNKITPYEKWYETKPNLSHLKVFGCVAYARIPDQERNKLDQKAEKMRFVGYSLQSKGYRLYDDTTHKIKIRRNVTFNESDYKLEKDVALQKENVTKQTVDIILEENENKDDLLYQQEKQLCRSERQKKAPVKFGYDEFADSVNVDSQVQHVAYNVCQTDEPKSIREAFEGDHAKEWKAATDSEYKTLIENNTWELTELPVGRKLIGSNWIFKVKYDNDGTVERFKGRLVAKGFTQEYGVDYDEMFSPVVRFSSIRTLLAYAVEKKMLIHQMDVVTAFLNGKLEEEIYMQQPGGYINPSEEH